MKIISIDMDGVLADVYKQFIKWHEEECGKIIKLGEVIGMTEEAAFPYLVKHVNSPGFFRTAQLIKDSQLVLQRLNEHYKVFIVSAAMEFPNSIMEKQLWLNEHFPFISWQQMVFCGSKEIIKADIMIDDHFKNLDYFTGETLLFTQPHNALREPGQHKRVDTWQEIERLLLP